MLRMNAPIVSVWLFLMWGSSAGYAQSDLNRIWLTWENKAVNPLLCQEKQLCTPVQSYITRLMENTALGKAQSTIGALDRLARARNLPAENPAAPNICQMTDAQKILGFEAESWPISEKLKALKGLQGVYFKLDGLKGPAGYEGPFGPQVQESVAQKLLAAGIPVLTEEQMEYTPGKPHLNIYFSNTNPDTGCWFSVFASLTQTMLLTRNHTVKLKAGTWGFSGGYSPDDPDRAEFDVIMMVVDRFIEDFTAANPDGVEPVAFGQQ